MTELLPCPFCGGEVQLVHRDAEPKNSECEYIDTDECEDCYECGWFNEYWYIRHRCETRYWTFDFDSDYCETEAEAIAAWNTRAERSMDYEDAAIMLDELGVSERTCRAVPYDGAPYLVCSECGAVQPEDFTVYYCWSCGAKVVEQ